jgi:hypothetical protein
MPKRVRQTVNRTRNTSSLEKRETIIIVSLHSETRSPRGVALRGRPSRRLFECPCDQCQGYATDDSDEPDLDDAGDAGDDPGEPTRTTYRACREGCGDPISTPGRPVMG